MSSTVVEDKDETAYPSQAISIVVGYPPGGGADSLARLLAKHLGKELASEVVVVNHVGSDGNVGAEAMCRAKADGYTLYLCARPNTLHKYLFASLEFDFAEDLIPIGLIAMTPNVIVASRHSPVRSLEDLLEIARTNPGQLRCASPGMGSTGYLLLEIFQQETGIDVDHIAYKGSSLAYLDLKEGRVDVLFSTLSSAIPHIREGTLQGLAIMSKTMDGHIVELPSMSDRGMPNLDVDSWAGLMVPSGTPESVIARLSEGINAVLKEEDVIAEMMQLGYATPPQPNPPEAMKKLGEEEAERWLAMMKDRGILPFH
ncbi:tripartite tricarboxylate transporter substrate binding protein [Achromobacter sp. HZ34]|nr:tripartite tricarboxylate transporter substrate-binding protein [Achromobacter sp. HZ34]